MQIGLAVLSAEILFRPAHSAAGEDRQALHTLVFEVGAVDRQTLTLKTGEIFKRNRPSRSDKQDDKAISAKFSIYGMEVPGQNLLRYWGASERDDDRSSSLLFSFCVARADFDALLSDVRAGLCPDKISVMLSETFSGAEGSSIRFGYDPDGADLIWDNSDQASTLPLSGIEFVRKLNVSAPENGEPGRGLEAIAQRLDKLALSVKQLGWLVGIAAAAILYRLLVWGQ